ncbi:MAG: hypothetical protein LBN22_02005 [Clostridiales Family XIII bacterium]|nr:hypothetical protein [Clostridiales Family XIII bacterium]
MNRTLIVKIAFALIGTMCLAMGAATLITANFGTDTFTASNLGGANHLGLSLGIYQLLFSVVVGILIWFLSPQLIGIGSLINIFLTGFIIDLFVKLIHVIPISFDQMGVRICLLVFGLLIYSLGISLYTGADIGAGSYDAISLVIAEKSKMKFIFARIITDSFFLLLGFVLGGPIGLVTFLAAVGLGPLISTWNRLFVTNMYKSVVPE